MNRLEWLQTEIIRDSQRPLSDVSKDAENNVVMVNSDKMVIDFDVVKEKWAELRNCRSHPASNDALIVRDKKERFIFVEFKNGHVNQ